MFLRDWTIIAFFLTADMASAADVQTVRLANVCTDFAVHPETQDLYAVQTSPPLALKFAAKSLCRTPHSETEQPIAIVAADCEQPIMEGACAIRIRQFDDRTLIAVVGTMDPRMMLLDAETLQVLHDIPLAATDVWQIASSHSPTDPWLYYFYGSGHRCGMGAVDLRTMKDLGTVIHECMDGAVSADGRFAWCRGSMNPSGLRCYERTNPVTDQRPEFRMSIGDHKGMPEWVPDPGGEFTASGGTLFTTDLRHQITQVPFSVESFSTRLPIVAGFDQPLNGPRNSSGKQAISHTTIRACSTNTFLTSPVSVPVSFEGAADVVPRPDKSARDFKSPAMRRRLLAADRRSEFLACFRDQICVVPFSLFNILPEPFLQASLHPTSVAVGVPAQIRFTPKDPVTRVTIDAPENSTFSGGVLTWTPSDADVGLREITAEISLGELRRIVRLPLTVTRPSLRAPFPIRDLLLLESTGHLVVWGGLDPRQDSTAVSEQSAERWKLPLQSLIGSQDR
ncbi:MAG: hypothetical protein R3C49_11125 [Planctomycetaceae bacterium]